MNFPKDLATLIVIPLAILTIVILLGFLLTRVLL
jgi:hypothetical protein